VDAEIGSVPDIFAKWVRQTPDADALILDEPGGLVSITYAELDAQSNAIAHYLIKNQIGPECIVALCMDRSASMIAAELAVLKAGAAYLPLDPNNPEARLSMMLEDSQAVCVLTDYSNAGLARQITAGLGLRVIDLEDRGDRSNHAYTR